MEIISVGDIKYKVHAYSELDKAGNFSRFFYHWLTIEIGRVVVRACYRTYFVEHVFKYLAPNFVSGKPA